MVYEKEDVYENLIQDYKNSIDSLKTRLAKTSDINDINKLSKQIQEYEEQLSKLEHSL